MILSSVEKIGIDASTGKRAIDWWDTDPHPTYQLAHWIYGGKGQCVESEVLRNTGLVIRMDGVSNGLEWLLLSSDLNTKERRAFPLDGENFPDCQVQCSDEAFQSSKKKTTWVHSIHQGSRGIYYVCLWRLASLCFLCEGIRRCWQISWHWKISVSLQNLCFTVIAPCNKLVWMERDTWSRL